MRLRSTALLLLLPLLAACGGSDEPAAAPSPSASPTRTAATAAPTKAPKVFDDPVRFSAAGGAVGCDLEPAFVECAVRAHTWKAPKKPADCHNNWGSVLQFTVGSKGQFICWFGLKLLGAKRVLPPGQAFRVGLVTCTAVPKGVECRDQTNGFRLTTSEYRLF
jgi:hypothetical protein